MKKFQVGKIYNAVYGRGYHCQVKVTKKTLCYVTFRLDEKMQRYFGFKKPEVQRRYKAVNGYEVAILDGTSIDNYLNWVVNAWNVVD